MRTGFPRIILKYIAGQMVRTFVLTLSVVTVLWVFVAALQLVRHFHVGPSQFLLILPLLATTSLAYSLPVAILFSVSIAYGRMSTENEIRAMAWNGVHLGWTLLPALSVALVAAVLGFYVNAELVPAAMRSRDQVISLGLVKTVNGYLLKAAQSNEPIEIPEAKVTVHVDGYDPDTRTITGVTIYVADDDLRLTRRIGADAARIVEGKVPGAFEFLPNPDRPESERRFLTLVFTNGRMAELDPDSGMAVTAMAALPSIAIDLAEDASRIEIKTFSLAHLARYSRNAENESQRNKARTLLFERISLGMSPLFFAFVAAPMAMAVRWKHTLTSFLPSLFVAIVIYYPLLMWARVQGESGGLDPLFGMFAANAVMLAVGIVLTVVVLRR